MAETRAQNALGHLQVNFTFNIYFFQGILLLHQNRLVRYMVGSMVAGVCIVYSGSWLLSDGCECSFVDKCDKNVIVIQSMMSSILKLLGQGVV